MYWEFVYVQYKSLHIPWNFAVCTCSFTIVQPGLTSFCFSFRIYVHRIWVNIRMRKEITHRSPCGSENIMGCWEFWVDEWNAVLCCRPHVIMFCSRFFNWIFLIFNVNIFKLFLTRFVMQELLRNIMFAVLNILSKNLWHATICSMELNISPFMHIFGHELSLKPLPAADFYAHFFSFKRSFCLLINFSLVVGRCEKNHILWWYMLYSLTFFLSAKMWCMVRIIYSQEACNFRERKTQIEFSSKFSLSQSSFLQSVQETTWILN